MAAVGEGVVGIAPGDRVAWAMRPGGVRDPRRGRRPTAAVPVPAGVSDELAAAVLLQGMTAQYLTHDGTRSSPATRCWCTRPPAARALIVRRRASAAT